ncbi:uncharacterized protein LOC122003544 [Zingiber officinale]|uniref:uncharacterized protein LOC122003544 n=1 Tax=Zingiber officinale TaxID=94328 RepID=UPI001C4C3E00|nr:uncharacterized protein LOC122003544 [Zingiber officinale]
MSTRTSKSSVLRTSIWKKKYISLMDLKSPSNHLLTLLLLTFLFSLDAVPLSRTLSLSNQDAAAITKVANQMTNQQMEVAERRMDVELHDYPGSGANSRHDPKNPGRS